MVEDDNFSVTFYAIFATILLLMMSNIVLCDPDHCLIFRLTKPVSEQLLGVRFYFTTQLCTIYEVWLNQACEYETMKDCCVTTKAGI